MFLIHNDRCTGCRACEMACSYHFSKLFNRKLSAVEVKRNEEEGIFEVIIHKESVAKRNACDLCKDEKIPLCVKYCTTGVFELKKE